MPTFERYLHKKDIWQSEQGNLDIPFSRYSCDSSSLSKYALKWCYKFFVLFNIMQMIRKIRKMFTSVSMKIRQFFVCFVTILSQSDINPNFLK